MKNKKLRKEKDSMGAVNVPFDAYWGAQTQRSLKNFDIGEEKLPLEFIHSYALLKKSVSQANSSLKLLSSKKAKFIGKACDEIMQGKLDKEFPLSVWQTGSGTQTNMNVNEVIANRASELSGGKKGDGSFHPNDDVNLSQSTNDSFPTAINISVALYTNQHLLPALKEIQKTLKLKQKSFSSVVKIGRTHLMDATPLTVGQEISAWISILSKSEQKIKDSLKFVYELPIGGTAVGTGLNTKKGYDKLVVKNLKTYTKLPFKVAPNKFEALSAHCGLLALSSSLKDLAVHLIKISNDIRFLSSGPRCGLSEYILPANEPGSSIMPGKVNPTHCEAMMMLSMQVISSETALNFADSFGNFQLNVCRPLIVHNLIQSLKLLSTGLTSFNDRSLKDLKINKKKVKDYVENSLMLITAVTPYIGYDKASEIAKKSYESGLSLKKQASLLGYISEKDFDKWVKPSDMIRENL